MRATSKRLCFNASMARSNRTLSGCLEPTLASGLLTFLLVQAVAMDSNIASDTINRVRHDIGPTYTEDCCGQPRRPSLAQALNFQQRGFVGCFQQLVRISLGVAVPEDGIARNQQLGPST